MASRPPYSRYSPRPLPSMTPSARRSPGIRGNKYDVVPPLLRMRIAEGVLNEIEEELVDEESIRAVKGVMSDLADEFMYAFIRDDLATHLLQDVVQDFLGHMINKTIAEVYIEDEVIEPVLAEMAVPIVLEVMQGFVDNMRADLMTEPEHMVVAKSLETVMLDYLVSLAVIAINPHMDYEADKLFDGLVVALLLHNMMDVNYSRQMTIHNRPLRRLHEKLFVDSAIDVLIAELIDNIDEDVDDIDEYERAMEIPGLRFSTDLEL